MSRRRHPAAPWLVAFTFLLWAATLMAPVSAWAWGPNAQRLIASRAVETLPPDVRPAGRPALPRQ